jgi:hypothetical protein
MRPSGVFVPSQVLPQRFLLWNYDEHRSRQVGGGDAYTTSMLMCRSERPYNPNAALRIHLEPHDIHEGTLYHTHLRIWEPDFIQTRVYVDDQMETTIYCVTTPFTVGVRHRDNDMDLYGQQQEILPVFIIYKRPNHDFPFLNYPDNSMQTFYNFNRLMINSILQVRFPNVDHAIGFLRDLEDHLTQSYLNNQHQPRQPRSRPALALASQPPQVQPTETLVAPAAAPAAAPVQPPLVAPTKPAERIALAIARDFVGHNEPCPITQERLHTGSIAVTGCYCVFQAEALATWASTHTTCPSCRTALSYRVVVV